MTASVRRAVLIYASAFAIAGATPFLLLPVLTRHLTPLQFGQATSFLVLAALLGNLGGLSAHGFISVRYFKVSAERFKAIVTSSMVAMAAAHVVMLALVVIIYPWLGRSLDLPFGYVVLAVLGALVLNLNLVSLSIFQASNRPGSYFQARALQGTIEITLCLLFIYALNAGAEARIYSYLGALAASAALGLWMCARRGQVGLRAEVSEAKGVLRFGVPMLPHLLAGTAVTYLDRLLVSALLGVESLGIYMVAMQVGLVMMALIEPLNKALAPWLFGQLGKEDEEVRRIIVKRTYLLFMALTIIGALLVLVSYKLFGRFIGEGFSAARALIPWMVAGFVCQGMYYTQVNYMFYAERTGMLSVRTASVAALGCAISYGLITMFGLQGAGAAFLVNNALLFLMVWHASSRAVKMPWRLGRAA
jgi:O-antigen/teichoic acid export membrane protein